MQNVAVNFLIYGWNQDFTLKCCINRCFCGNTELHSGHLKTDVTRLLAFW